jgi:drug/metabolite transporter (DMT)-like permease
MVPAFLTTILFSLSAIFGKRLTKIMSGLEANFWRLAMACALLGLWILIFPKSYPDSVFIIFFISGCVGFGLGDFGLFQALPRLGSRSTVLLVHCIAAPFAACVEWLWLGTVLTVLEITCAFVILVGVAIALAPDRQEGHSKKELLFGIGFGVLAAFGQGLGAVISRKGYSVLQFYGQQLDGPSVTFQRIVGGLLVSGVALFLLQIFRSKELTRRSPEKWSRGWYLLLFNAIAGPTLGVSCYQWALETTPTGVVLPIVAITPLVIIPIAQWLEGERATMRSLIGGLIAVAGAVCLAVLR